MHGEKTIVKKIAKFLTSVIVSHRLTSSTNSMIESFEKIIRLSSREMLNRGQTLLHQWKWK